MFQLQTCLQIIFSISKLVLQPAPIFEASTCHFDKIWKKHPELPSKSLDSSRKSSVFSINLKHQSEKMLLHKTCFRGKMIMFPKQNKKLTGLTCKSLKPPPSWKQKQDDRDWICVPYFGDVLAMVDWRVAFHGGHVAFFVDQSWLACCCRTIIATAQRVTVSFILNENKLRQLAEIQSSRALNKN